MPRLAHIQVHRVLKGLLNNFLWVMGLRGKLINSLCTLFTDNIMHYLDLCICMEYDKILKSYFILRLFYCVVVQKVKWRIWLKTFTLLLISCLCTWLRHFPLAQFPWSSLLWICEVFDQMSWLADLIMPPLYDWFPMQQQKGDFLSPFLCLLFGKERSSLLTLWWWFSKKLGFQSNQRVHTWFPCSQ